MKIMDMHCDTFSHIYKNETLNIYKNELSVDYLKLKKGNYIGQCFAMFVKYNNKDLYNTCLKMIEAYKKQMNIYKDCFLEIFKYEDFIKAFNENKIASILTIEEGAVIENDLNKLNHLYDLGVRMITLTWNYPNQIGHPNIQLSDNIDFSKVDNINGLTDFGIKMVRKMNELGIVIDVSHLSDKGVYDILKYSCKPFVASHSNSRTIANNCRNLSDDLIKKLANKKCVIGINYCKDFITSNNKSDLIKELIKHIKHIVCIGGIDVVGLGSDFDGIPQNDKIKDASFVPLLINELKKENFNEEDISKICYKNVLRVFKENMN